MTPTLTLAALRALLVTDGMAALARPREPVAFTLRASATGIVSGVIRPRLNSRAPVSA